MTICSTCRFYKYEVYAAYDGAGYPLRGVHTCRSDPIKKTDPITGKEYQEFRKCLTRNKNLDCEGWKINK